MTCQNLQNKLLNITVLFIWYLLVSLKKMSLAKHGELYFIWRVLVSVHSPFWLVFEKNGFPHSNIDIVNSLLKCNSSVNVCDII